MKKLHWLFMAICLAVMPALQSCDDNDGYSLGDFTPPLWATVRVTGNAFYLNCDVWGTLWPVNTDIGWYDAVDGQRVQAVKEHSEAGLPTTIPAGLPVVFRESGCSSWEMAVKPRQRKVNISM